MRCRSLASSSVLGALICTFIVNPALAKRETCETDSCKTRSNMVRRQLNQRIQPCQDYFGYVCGKWRGPREEVSLEVKTKAWKDLERSLNKSSYASEVESAVKNFVGAYKSCIRKGNLTKDVTALRRILREFDIANWPLDAAVKRPYTNVLLLSGLQPIFKYHVHLSHTPGVAGKIYLGAPTDFYVLSADYEEYINDEATAAAYQNLIKEIIKKFKPTLTEEKVKNISDGIIDFEKRLQELAYESTDDTIELKIGDFSERTKIAEADFPLLDILNRDFSAAAVPLEKNDIIFLTNKTYYEKVINSLKEGRFPTWVVMNYIGWCHIRDLLDVASTDLKNLKTKFEEDSGFLFNEPMSKPERCLKELVQNGLMYGAASKFYINKKFNESDRKRVEEVARRVKHSVQTLVDQTEWMDNTTKTKAMHRISRMKLIMGFEDNYTNTEFLEKIYKFVGELHPKNPFLRIYFNLTRNERFRRIRSVRLEHPFVNLEEYGPLRSHALYNEKDDVLAYPAAALLTHYAGSGLPGFINYASIGANTARAMSNAFDKDDRINGTDKEFWSEETKAAYCKAKISRELQDTYCENAKDKDNVHAVSFADHVAVRAAFQAYENASRQEDQLLPELKEEDVEQQFFLFFANAYCPFSVYDRKGADNASVYKEGLDLLVTNYTGFEKAYNCSSGRKRQ